MREQQSVSDAEELCHRSSIAVLGTAGMKKKDGEQTFIIPPDLGYGASRSGLPG